MTTTDPQVPRSASAFGLRIVPTGTHLSSTLKLDELRMLLAGQLLGGSVDDYKTAIVDQNVLGKPTVASRRITFYRLRELYGLDGELLVLRALADLWDVDVRAQPMIALLCATARDPILRAVTPYIMRLPIGGAVTKQEAGLTKPTFISRKSSCLVLVNGWDGTCRRLGRKRGCCPGNERR